MLEFSVAFVWLATGALVLHPYYRSVGHGWLSRLGVGDWAMYATCAAEVALAALLVARPFATSLTWLQVLAVATFTAVLAWLEPRLLVHPFGMLTKNLPLLSVVVAGWLLAREGWSGRATWVLRAGMAVVWLTEGLFPKILFQQSLELAVVENSGLVPFDASVFLRLMGAAQVLAGVAALLLRGRALGVLLWLQALALVVLPLLVSWQDPLLWVHPFGPMTKNVPILAGTLVLARRC